MSNKVILMHQIRSIIQYLSKGYSLRAISRELHMSRKTVTQYSERLKCQPVSLEELRGLSDAELSAIVYSPVKTLSEDARCKFW